jgi:hypothetical protein
MKQLGQSQMTHRIGLWSWLAVALCFAAGMERPAWANGGYFAEVAYPARPTIPTQRAIIVQRGGVETLVVESGFESQAQTVGWVLPLPAEPTKLEVGDPGMVVSLMMCLKPVVLHDDRGVWVWPLFALVVAVFMATITVFAWKENRLVWGRVCGIALGGLLFSCCLLVPSLGSAAKGIAGGTSFIVGPAQRVGNYEVRVLAGSDAVGVADWLAKEGFVALDRQGQQMVEDYVHRGWCFVVAKLQRTGGGAGVAMPHPLMVTFPTAQPVFPMKLTALAGGRTHVELCVIADKQAEAKRFKCVVADRFDPVPQSDDGDFIRCSFFAGSHTQVNVGSPDVGALMWPGCVATRLVADMSAQDMADDVVIGLRELKPYRERVWSAKYRAQVAAGMWFAGAALVVLIAGWMARKRRRPSRNQLLFLGGVALAVVAGGAVARVAMPVAEVTVHRKLGRFLEIQRMERLALSTGALGEKGLLRTDMTDQELGECLKRAVDSDELYPGDVQNPWTGREMACERSPGNFAWRREGSRLFMCVYDPDGREFRMEVPSRIKASSPGDTDTPAFLTGDVPDCPAVFHPPTLAWPPCPGNMPGQPALRVSLDDSGNITPQAVVAGASRRD